MGDFRKAIFAFLLPACLAWLTLDARAQDVRDKVRKTLRESGLEKSVKNLSVFSQIGGGHVSLSGRAASGEIKKKVLAAVRGVPGVTELDAARLHYPTFDVVVKSNLETHEVHRNAYLQALHHGYAFSARTGGDDEFGTEDGPAHDGVVPLRAVIEHVSKITFGDTITASAETGNVVRVNDTLFGAFPGSPVPQAGDSLGPGYRFHYTLQVREKGTIKYTFQQWDGAQHKNLYTASWPITTARTEPVAQSPIALGRPPAKAPPCPIDVKAARDIAVLAILPPKPDMKTLSAKSSAIFAGSFDVLAKRLVTQPKERIPVELEIRNQSPWPMSSASFYIVDPVNARKGGQGFYGGVQIQPPLLPGEKRKVTGQLPAVGKIYFAPFGSRILSIVKFDPGFTLTGILD